MEKVLIRIELPRIPLRNLDGPVLQFWTSSGDSMPANFTSARPAWMRTLSMVASRV